jgi:2-oxoisovalerate dehydrogenase E2 component (dihydrolipoyl transacylase)
MPTEIRLPQLGESVHEGTLGRWLKRPGDTVAKYEPLVEVMTDKVNVEMPSPFAGVLTEILVQEGQTVAAGTVIAVIEEQAVAAGAAAPTAAGPPARAPDTPARVAGRPAPISPAPGVSGRSGTAEGVRLTPLVRRLAEEHHLKPEELKAIEGTGTGGRITKEDVLRYVERRGVPLTTHAGAAPSALPTAAVGRAPGDELHPLSALRRTIADRMIRSMREIPHAFGVTQVDMTALVRHRETHKAAWRQREGTNITITAFVVRAATRAIRAYPALNSTFTPEGILYRNAIHFGVGVAIPDGLIVPVIKDADRRTVVDLSHALDDLSNRAREGKLTLEDVSGGTFTLTNPGVFGSVFSMPIINYPQAAILVTDAIMRRPVVIGDGIVIRDIMHLGLAFDHRIFDGAVAMQFLNHMKKQLEEFTADGDSPEF